MPSLDDPSTWVAIIEAAALVFAFYQLRHQDRRDDFAKLNSTLSDHSSRIVKLETKIDLFWNFVETELPKVLHSPHTPEIDELQEKFDSGKATDTEILELKNELGAIWQANVAKWKEDKDGSHLADAFAARLRILGIDGKLVDQGKTYLIGKK